MPTNNYDTVAVKRAREFANKENLCHAYVEKPAMYSLLPDLQGKKVLCIGCGTGEECIELLSRGASVWGIDSSKASITYAREHAPQAHFEVADMDTDLGSVGAKGPFDLVYASLAVHYSDNITKLFNQIHRMLVPHGQFLFSVCHPVKWSAESHRDPHDHNKKSFIMGYERDGENARVYGNYLEEQRLSQTFPDGLKVDYWMRTPSSYFKLLTTNGFKVLEFAEPSPLPAVKAIDPTFWEINHKLPQWIIFLATAD